jgi:hypothetical protein
VNGLALTCANGGDVATGIPQTFTIRGTLDGSLLAGTVLTNRAIVTSPTADPTPSNNSATAATAIGASAPSGRITGNVYDDADGSGTRDTGEPDITGVVVQLFAAGADATLGTADDVLVTTATTASPYEFENLLVGAYRVAVDTTTLPAGFEATNDADGGADSHVDVMLAADQSATGVDFGYHPAPTVAAGSLGSQSTDELGLPFTGGSYEPLLDAAVGTMLTGVVLRVAVKPKRRDARRSSC